MPHTPCCQQAHHRRDALVLTHLSLADALARAFARRFSPLLDRDDLIQVAREALLHCALRCDPDRQPAAPYLRRCIQGALQHHLRDQVRLVRIPRRAHESGRWPLGHLSLDAPHADGGSLIDQLCAPPLAEPTAFALGESFRPGAIGLEPEALLNQLPAPEAAALRLTVLQGLSLRRAAAELHTSTSSVARWQRQGLQALRLQVAAV